MVDWFCVGLTGGVRYAAESLLLTIRQSIGFYELIYHFRHLRESLTGGWAGSEAARLRPGSRHALYRHWENI